MMLESIFIFVMCAGLLFMTASAAAMLYRLCTQSQEMEDDPDGDVDPISFNPDEH